MEKNRTKNKQDTMKIVVNGKNVSLSFMQEPNYEASAFIKKILLEAYLIKAV